MRSDRLGESLLPKRYALPIFASDPLSSVAYATQEILIILTLAGTAFLYLAPWLAVGVVVLLITVVLSYRQVVHAYPSGGGDYEVAMKNHGQFAALTVASALLVDYVLTVAVSVSAGTDNIISAFPGLNEHRVLIAVCLVALLAAANLRGVRESGRAFAVPTYLFISGIAVMIVTGLIRWFFTDGGLVAETAAVHGLSRARLRTARRPRSAVLRPPGLRVRVYRPDRGRGDRQRRPGVQSRRRAGTRPPRSPSWAASPPRCSPGSPPWPCCPTSSTSRTPATSRASPTVTPSRSAR